MKKIFLMQNNSLDIYKYNAGSKARNDVFKIINKNPAVDFRYLYKGESKFRKLASFVSNLLQIRTMEDSTSLFICEHPFLELNPKLFSWYKRALEEKKPKVKTVCIIHDVEALRYHPDKKEEELEFLNSFDYLIDHNSKMTEWLRENNIKTKIIELNLFDYLIPDFKLSKKVDYNQNKIKVAYAGNLAPEKSGFLYKLSSLNYEHLHLSLYGANFDESTILNQNKVTYYGSKDPDELPSCMDADYGLIWDGPDLRECSGMMGHYLKYNNPHKLSLYMAAGIPVIVWRNSAISEFVMKNHLGICVDYLDEIHKIDQISENEYTQLKNNVLSIRSRAINGQYLVEALKKIEDDVIRLEEQ